MSWSEVPTEPPLKASAVNPVSAQCSGSTARDWWHINGITDPAFSKDLFPGGTPRKIYHVR
eukprot:CAMPEP_0198535252 /NCGR_PEP_ID=MMETSP1462-20131121/38725_1 /TAXON_ID=1333877 /ORGANISM="Brandtodinium nutriculum, Strain RCC3387" /LENGTH=60 /DNA_ID=CAMNT_0044265189 /DNA_START=33 /DNA_END=212 /DNA_ORIENTATION=+